ncbi:hypothetical protein ACWIGW_39325 [Nocardia brasiliensis]
MDLIMSFLDSSEFRMTANAAHDLVWSFGGPVMARNAALALKFGVPGVTAAMMVGGAVSQVVIDGRYDRLHTPEDYAWSLGRGALSTLVGASVGNRIAGRLGAPTSEMLTARQSAGRILGGMSGNLLASTPASRRLTDEARAGLHHLAGWTGGLVPTIDIGAGVLLPGMPDQFLMPGPGILRHESEEHCRAAPGIIAAQWTILGDADKLGIQPAQGPPDVRGRENSGIDPYGDLAERQTVEMATFRAVDSRIPESVERAGQLADEAKKAIFDVITTLNRNAQTPAPQFSTQDEWTLHCLDIALHDAEQALRKAHRAAANVSADISALANSTFRTETQATRPPSRYGVTDFPTVTT